MIANSITNPAIKIVLIRKVQKTKGSETTINTD